MNQELFERACELFKKPLMELIYEAQQIHHLYHNPTDIQKCALLSIKTGGCPEDCAYCPQSIRYQTPIDLQALMSVEEVTAVAQQAKNNGAQRFCMGAAWRRVKNGAQFEQVLAMVRSVKNIGLQVCVTLGMLTQEQAYRLKDAGVFAYNHNLDTSREYYKKIITTRTYEDRLQTLRFVRHAGMTVCSGGIIGMGENIQDRCALLAELASLQPQPESVPINLLIPVKGTPLGNSPPVDSLDFIRMVAVARILIPQSRVRLSAGRTMMNRETQILAFLAGANSIFIGEVLLTQNNPELTVDDQLLASLGIG